MAVLLIYLSLILSLFYFLKYKTITISQSIIGSLFLNSIFIFLSSEILSIFNSYAYLGLFIFWVLIDLSLLLVLNKNSLEIIKTKLINGFSTLFQDKIFIFFIFIYLLVLTQGLLYPPNNWDSLTYHMGRIPHWIENQSIFSYPTHIYRQIYSPPLAELIVSQFCILNKSDLLANSIQFLFLIGCIATVKSICFELNFTKRATIFAVIFLLTTPEILLQSSSTQNDIIVSFYLLTSILFCIKSYKNTKLISIIILAIAVGLSVYTKGTAYIYLFPILSIWGIMLLKKVRSMSIFLKFGLIPFMILLINSGFYYRNYILSGDILGKNEDHLFNEEIGIKPFLLTTLKNVGNHLAVYPLSDISNKIVEKMHLVLGEEINNPKTNFNGISFKLEKWQHHEDTASNVFQICFIFISIILYIKQRKKHSLYLFLLVSIPILEFILFTLVLKWQPWHTRLQTPLFFMSCFFVAYILDYTLKNKKITSPFILFPFTIICFYSLVIVVFNSTRPFVSNRYTNRINLNDTRFKKYCANYTPYEEDYRIARYFLQKYKGEVGVEFGGDMWEYLLYFDIFNSNLKIGKPIYIDNISKKLLPQKKHVLRYIISYKNEKQFRYNNINYLKINHFKLFTIYSKQ